MIVELLPIGIGALSLAAAWLHAGRLRTTHVERHGTATLLLALTGEARGLDRLVRALERQTLKPRRLVIAVESADDPALAAVSRLGGRAAFPIETVIAGRAARAAQKCTNLIAAARRIDAKDEVVVLLDGDIEPPAWWLSALVSPLQTGHCDLVTGYRWPMIEAHAPGAHLVAAIDRTIAILPRIEWARAVWGGSLAMSRHSFRRLDLERLLARTLSDDLTIGAAAADRGLRVLTRRSLLVSSPDSRGIAEAWSFGRRQYQMIRLYRPWLWAIALLTMTAQCAGWGVILAHFQTSGTAVTAGSVLLLLALIKQWRLDRTGRRLGQPDARSVRYVQTALALCKPLVDGVHLSMIVAAAQVRTVSWAHLTYRVAGPSQITILQRKSWHGSSD